MKSITQIIKVDNSRPIVFILIVLIVLLVASCKKAWLEEKPDSTLVIVKTLKDVQALMDNATVMNSSQVALGELGTDDYFLLDSDMPGLYFMDRKAYTWEKDVYEGADVLDWNAAYQRINYANIGLQAIADLGGGTYGQAEFNNVKGQALFVRAFTFYSLSQVFMKAYDVTSSNSDLGLPLRLSPDINLKIGRSTVEETYTQIIKDLKESIRLLPSNQAVHYYYRADRPTAFALLSKTYLSMRKYDEAFLYADSCLQLRSTLLDYNTLSSSIAFPFQTLHSEILYYMTLQGYGGIRRFSYVDSTLYAKYANDDLRKTLFFTTNANGAQFRGFYNTARTLFGGIGLDDIYLIRAESNARLGNKDAAMSDLNKLLRTRWRKINGVSTYVDQTAADANEALQKILLERQKQLLFRDTRWTDLRRLNKDSQFAKTLTRKVGGQLITLPPNDNRYVYEIPPFEILYNRMEQNPR